MQNQVQKAQGSIKGMAKSIGRTEVPTVLKLREVADTTGSTLKIIDLDKTAIKNLVQKITAKNEGRKDADEVGKITDIKEKNVEKHIIKGENGRKELSPNVCYVTKMQIM